MSQPVDNFIKYSQLAFQMLAVILAGAFGGLKLDEKFNNGEQLYVVILLPISVFIAVFLVIKDFINLRK